MNIHTFRILNSTEQKRVTDSTMTHALTGVQMPGSLISYPQREKTLVNKISSTFSHTYPTDVVDEMRTSIDKIGSSWYCIDSTNNWNRLVNTEHLLLVTNASELMEFIIAPNAQLTPTDKLTQAELLEIQTRNPSIWNYVTTTTTKSFLWHKVVAYREPSDPSFVPAQERIVVSSGEAFSLKCRAAYVTCI